MNRFTNMDWTIFTPKGCAHWDGKVFSFIPGIPDNPVETPDPLEAAWRVYCRHIFNPVRLKVKAMQSEMPKRYWKSLPEAELIAGMLAEEPRPVRPRPKNASLDKLRDLSVGESA